MIIGLNLLQSPIIVQTCHKPIQTALMMYLYNGNIICVVPSRLLNEGHMSAASYLTFWSPASFKDCMCGLKLKLKYCICIKIT